MRPRNAFTLIELMVATALGLAVMLLLVIAFRAVAGTINATRRLAVENGLLRQGVLAAFEEADFWTFWDDPDDAANTKMRRFWQQYPDGAHPGSSLHEDGSRLGLAFTPLKDVRTLTNFQVEPEAIVDPDPTRLATRIAASDSQVAARAAAPTGAPNHFPPVPADLRPGAVPSTAAVALGNLPALTTPVTALPVPAPELVRGWEKDYHWSAADERTWCRLNLGEAVDGDQSNTGGGFPLHRGNKPSGRYVIFESPKPVVVPGDTTDLARASGYRFFYIGQWLETSNGTGRYTRVESRHSWRSAQVLGLRQQLALYGWVEYLPANQPLCNYGWSLDGVDYDEVIPPAYNRWPGGVTPQICNAAFNACSTGGQGENTIITLYPYNDWSFPAGYGVNRDSSTPYGSNSAKDQASLERSVSAVAGLAPSLSGLSYFRQWMAGVIGIRPLMNAKPVQWPKLSLVVGRWLCAGRLVPALSVRMDAPLSGQFFEITCNAFGTTLRGARQQRHRDGGWALFAAPTGHLAEIAAGKWYARTVLGGSPRYVLQAGAPASGPSSVPRPLSPAGAALAVANDPTLDDY